MKKAERQGTMYSIWIVCPSGMERIEGSPLRIQWWITKCKAKKWHYTLGVIP